jgi:hypothetical protein
MQIDYSFQLLPETVLLIADTEKWLLPAELKALQDGLKYGFKEENHYYGKWSYRGYLNAQRQPQGVGILTYEDGDKDIG